MRETTVCSTLVVCFDGQFWVGYVERVENGLLSSCRVVFGAEPSNEEILKFVLREWTRLPLGGSVTCTPRKKAGNPKRRQRQAAKEMERHGPSTKAQRALAEQREHLAKECSAHRKRQRDEECQLRFEHKQKKAKEKKRGH